jgi:hypothetical protein
MRKPILLKILILIHKIIGHISIFFNDKLNHNKKYNKFKKI